MELSQDIESALSAMGLVDKEIALYVLLLQTGTSPASSLSKRARLPRSTAQYICQQLARKGFASMTQKNNVYLFTAEPPEKILRLLEREHAQITQKEKQMQRVMGDLQQMMSGQAVLPKVQFYEGSDGMIELYDKILDLHSPIDSFEDKGEMVAFLPDYVKEHIARRVDRKIWNRVICPSNTTVNISTPKEHRETRTMTPEDFPFTCDIKISKDLVSIFSFQHSTAVGIAIRHPEIADNFRILFNSFWKMLGERAEKR